MLTNANFFRELTKSEVKIVGRHPHIALCDLCSSIHLLFYGISPVCLFLFYRLTDDDAVLTELRYKPP